MLFTEFNMDDALEVRYEEGFMGGEAKGMAQTIGIIRKKLLKNISPEEVAVMLELDIPYVSEIARLCTAHPDETDIQIAERYLSVPGIN